MNYAKGFYERLIQLRPDHIESDTAYAKYLKIYREQLSRWRHGHNVPTTVMAERLAKKLGVSASWLMFGD